MTAHLFRQAVLRRFFAGAGLLIVLGALAACDGTATPTAAPTSTIEATPILPTATVDIGTPPPTATPRLRATLPPTWTPVGGVTATRESGFQLEMVQATPAVCNAFRVDRVRTVERVKIGNAVTVYWTPIEAVTRYRVRLFDARLNELLVEYTQGGQFTFDAALFEADRRYGWEVFPENATFQQMCFTIGGELTASVQ
jgi:hypothetical protein